MKKVCLILAGLIAILVINAQSLDEIVKMHSIAIMESKLEKVKTMKITSKLNSMGTDMSLVIYVKSPNKLKQVISVNGVEIVQVFDGEKAYMINPMAGSPNPVELPADQAEQFRNNSSFKSQVSSRYKEGKLTLEGEENVNDKPAFKLKTTNSDGSPIYYFIDKATYLPVKTSMTVNQMGNKINIESYTAFSEINGLMLPKTTTSFANGMQAAVMTIENVDAGIQINDSVFKVK